MIEVFVKHSATCAHRDNRLWRRCNCRKWLYNTEWKPDPRRSAKTRSWERAVKLARSLEQTGTEQITMREAVEQFLKDKRAQNVTASWLRKFEVMLTDWIPDRTLASLTLKDLEEFRSGWTGASVTRRKRQERLRSFFNYCVRHKWLAYNLASDLSKIKVEDRPTMPLEREQFDALLEKADGDFRALVLLMRYSGLRITDAVAMSRDKLKDATVFLRTQKTKTVVRVPIPEDVAKEIAGHLPLYRGGMTLKSRVTSFQEQFQALGVHSHQLRDTFAVELLLAGVPIEDVSQLLGHSDIKITLRHYAPWVKARQEKLEAAVRKSWIANK